MKRFDQINVIPFIDIMLVLLAIVLTTATFIAQGTIPVDLPKADNAEAVSADEKFEIIIDEAGEIHHEDTRMSLQQLDDHLQGLSPDTRILLRVDSNTRFDAFVGVVDRLKGRDLHNVSILTEKRS